MNVKQALKFIDALVFEKTGKHLNDIQRVIIQAYWSEKRQTYAQIASTKGYSVSYLKQDVGPKFCKLLSNIFGEKIQKSNFRATIERIEGPL